MTDLADKSELMHYFATIVLVDSVAVASKTVSHAYNIRILHDLTIVLPFGTALVVSPFVVYTA